MLLSELPSETFFQPADIDSPSLSLFLQETPTVRNPDNSLAERNVVALHLTFYNKLLWTGARLEYKYTYK